MLDYVCQRSLPTIPKPIQFIHIISITFIFLNSLCLCFHGIDSQSIEKPSLHRLFKVRHVSPPKRLLRILYFREFDMTINEYRLKNDLRNLTESYEIDLKIKIFNQSTILLSRQVCSLIAEEKRDTILIADLYTKEVDLISRSLKIPTIVTTNRYQIVQAKQVRF